MVKSLILLSVAAVVPCFFILTWLFSSYHRLVGLRDRVQQAHRELQAMLKENPAIIEQQNLSRNLVLRSEAYHESVSAYNKFRDTFPANLIAKLCHFSQAVPFDFKS
jgi:hypothetical protein